MEIGTLDAMVSGSPCALLKIEFGDMEEDAILGGRYVTKTNNPIIYVENDRLEKTKALIALMVDLNYRLWWHVPPLFNPNDFFGNTKKIYVNLTSCFMFCCRGDLKAAKGLVEIKSPDDPRP